MNYLFDLAHGFSRGYRIAEKQNRPPRRIFNFNGFTNLSINQRDTTNRNLSFKRRFTMNYLFDLAHGFSRGYRIAEKQNRPPRRIFNFNGFTNLSINQRDTTNRNLSFKRRFTMNYLFDLAHGFSRGYRIAEKQNRFNGL